MRGRSLILFALAWSTQAPAQLLEPGFVPTVPNLHSAASAQDGTLYVASDHGIRIVRRDHGLVRAPSSLTSVTGFAQIGGIAAGADGSVFVTDTGNNRVIEYPAVGGVLAADRVVAGGAALTAPTGIAVARDGTLLVIAGPLRTIVALARNGDGTYGAPAPLAASASVAVPRAIAVDAHDNLFVADGVAGIIREFAYAGGQWTALRDVASVDAVALAVDPAGDLLVTTADGFLRIPFDGTDYGAPGPVAPLTSAPATAIAASGSDVVFTVEGGQLIERDAGVLADAIEVAPGVYTPLGLAVDAAGNVVSAYFTPPRVEILERRGGLYEGPHLLSIALAGTQPGPVAVNGDGDVYLIDRESHTLRWLARDGDGYRAPVAIVDLSSLRYPQALALDTAGNLYVLDGGIGVYIARKSGNTFAALQLLPIAGLEFPVGIAVDGAGTLYVADSDTGHVVMVGTPATSPGAPVVVPVPAWYPGELANVAVDGGGNVYALTTSRIYRIPFAGGHYGDPEYVDDTEGGPLTFGPEGNLYFAGDSGIAVRSPSDPPGPLYKTLPSGSPAYTVVAARASSAGTLYLAHNAGVLALEQHGVERAFPVELLPGREVAGMRGMDLDADGNVFLTRWSSDHVIEYARGDGDYTGDPVAIGSGLVSLANMVTAHDGSLFAVNATQILHFPRGAGGFEPPVPVGSAFYDTCLSASPAGDLFVGCTSTSVSRIAFVDGTAQPAQAVLATWTSVLANDAANNLLLSPPDVSRATPDGDGFDTPVTVGSFTNTQTLSGLAPMPDGTIFAPGNLYLETVYPRLSRPTVRLVAYASSPLVDESSTTVVVAARDDVGSESDVTQDTVVALEPVGSTTTLDANACTIPAGWSQCSITTRLHGANPRLYLRAEVLSGDALDPAIAGPIDVVPAPPTLVSVVSRKVHGSAGSFDVPLKVMDVTNPVIEPRAGSTARLVFTFDQSIATVEPIVVSNNAGIGGFTIDGQTVTVDLVAVPARQYVQVSLFYVRSSPDGAPGTAYARVGFLAGDVTGNGTVTLSDMAQVNARLARPVDATNFRYDVNANGTLSVADLALVNANLTGALPPP